MMNNQTPPDKIWLQWHEYDDAERNGRTWCEDKQNDSDVEYVRADTIMFVQQDSEILWNEVLDSNKKLIAALSAQNESDNRIAERDKRIAELEEKVSVSSKTIELVNDGLEKIEGRVKKLQSLVYQYEEREALYCPEGVRFEEYVTVLQKRIAELEADKIACVAVMRRMIGYRDRVGALSFQLEKADFFINQMRELLGDAEGEQ